MGENIMYFLKNFQLTILLVFLLATAYLLFSPLIMRGGLSVALMDEKSRCGDMKIGDSISQVSGSSVKSVGDFERVTGNVKSGSYVTMVVNSGPGGCVAIQDGIVGVSVQLAATKPLSLSLDIGGGTIFFFKPADSGADLQKMVGVLNDRVTLLKLFESKVDVAGSMVKITAVDGKNIDKLTKIGKFEAKISESVALKNGTGKLLLGEDVYDVRLVDDYKRVEIAGQKYAVKDRAVVGNIKIDILNITNMSANLELVFFGNDDVVSVLDGYVQSAQVGYDYYIPVKISDAASENFAKITKRMGTVFAGGMSMLDGMIVYYIDGEEFSKLGIPFEMAGNKLQQNAINIVGIGKNFADANEKKIYVEVLLKTESLPSKLSLVKTEHYTGALENSILQVVGGTAAAGFVFVLLVNFVKYKNFKLALSAFILIGAEIVFMLGIAALSRNSFGTGWLIDIPSVAGFGVWIVLSTLYLFSLSEKMIGGRLLGVDIKQKKIGLSMLLEVGAVFVGFILLFTMWRGVGIIIILGEVIGILLTRPIYKKILEKYSQKSV